jgi:hypothetical protein
MPFVVEDGSGLPDATSYASTDFFDNYTDDRGYAVGTGDTEQALIRATQVLDATYARRFTGTRTNGREQALEWPRSGATDIAGNAIPDDEIPIEILEATAELALREVTVPGSTMPDLARGGSIRSLRAGSVAIEYGANASSTTIFSLINGILAPLIGSLGAFVGTVTRG